MQPFEKNNNKTYSKSYLIQNFLINWFVYNYN